MNVLALVPTVLGALGALGGLGALVRARALNRLDGASGRKADAEAENIEVRTARELIAEVRAEMDRRVSDLDRELGRLRGHLERTREERDELRETERALRTENRQLRQRVETLEGRVRILTTAAELAESTVRAVADLDPTTPRPKAQRPDAVDVHVSLPPAP